MAGEMACLDGIESVRREEGNEIFAYIKGKIPCQHLGKSLEKVSRSFVRGEFSRSLERINAMSKE